MLYLYRNAYHAHPENMLMAMLTDDRFHVRKQAVDLIIQHRGGSDVGDASVREFTVPTLNYSAKTYTELISWEDTTLYEPIFTTRMPLKALKSFQESPLMLENFPVHTQSVERAVKLVSEACQQVCGRQSRDGFIRARMLSRQLLPVPESKTQFKAMVHTSAFETLPC